MKKNTRNFFLDLLFCCFVAVGSFTCTDLYAAPACSQVNRLSLEFLDSQKVSNALEILLNAGQVSNRAQSKTVLDSMSLIHFLDAENRTLVLGTLINARPGIRIAAFKFINERDVDFLSDALFSDLPIHVRVITIFKMCELDRRKPEGEKLFQEAIEKLSVVETDPLLLALADYYLFNCAEDISSPECKFESLMDALEERHLSLSERLSVLISLISTSK